MLAARVRGSFDAAVSVVASHDVNPLEESCAHLATMLPPGGRLVVDEIDIDRYDERAIRLVELCSAKRSASMNTSTRRQTSSVTFASTSTRSSGCSPRWHRISISGDRCRVPICTAGSCTPACTRPKIDLIAERPLLVVGCRMIARRK